MMADANSTNGLQGLGLTELDPSELVSTDGGAVPVVIYIGIKASTVFKSAVAAAGAGAAAGYTVAKN